MRSRFRFARVLALALAVAVAPIGAQTAGGRSSIRAQDLREWLTYVSSDQLEGRALYSAGLGLAASYIEDHLREWGVRPAGDSGSYLQTVRVLGVKSSNHSTLTVQVGRERRVFKDGDGITFPKNVGGKRRLTIDRVEFAGYGLDAPLAGHVDYRGVSAKDAAVVWLGPEGPNGIDAQTYRRLLSGRNRYATEQQGAAASLGPEMRQNRGVAPPATPAAAPAAIPRADFTTGQRLDNPIAPNATGSDALFEFLFSRAPVKYEELKRRADAQEPLPTFRLEGVTLTFDLDADYEVVRTQLSHNVVGMVEGSDPQLRSTYVAFGAHYDHVGYAEGAVAADGGRRLGAPGRVTAGAMDDRIWNGADDDGSGTVSLMAVARAFALGSRPKRSVLFVGHTGEERGLLGSRYFADYPTVPIDAIVAQLNIDMVGRNRDDKPSEADTVYIVGSDRISTELDGIDKAANASLEQPLTLDYEMNDPSDLEQLYYRSDHYSYAAKGIPIIFYTTGLHPDYHANTDEVSRILFDKMTRIVQLVYETGVRVAELDHAPARDNRGPQTGKNGPLTSGR
jgi:hypothetical protein